MKSCASRSRSSRDADHYPDEEPVMPKHLDQIAATSTKDVKVSGMRIASKRFLHLE